MKKFLSVLCTASALTVAAVSAQAATVTLTSVSGVWSARTGGVNVNGLGTSSLSWGTGNNQSGYDFDAVTGLPEVYEQDVLFDLGTFSHRNFPISAGTSITSATLDVAFSFYLDSDPGNLITRSSTFVFAHNETPNAANPCANGEPNNSDLNVNGCADSVKASTNPSGTETFQIADEDGNIRTYVFDVTGFVVGGNPLEEFWTVENYSNSAVLQARFTYAENILPPAPIPLPAAAWLLMGGVGALGVASRRRRSA